MPQKPPSGRKDLLLVGGPTDDGSGVKVLRSRQERLEVGTLHPLKHGQSIHGDVVKLTPHPRHAGLFEVETEVAGLGPKAPPLRVEAEAPFRDTPPRAQPDERATPGGPAAVATDAYRRNWDAIWSRPSRGARKLPN